VAGAALSEIRAELIKDQSGHSAAGQAPAKASSSGSLITKSVTGRARSSAATETVGRSLLAPGITWFLERERAQSHQNRRLPFGTGRSGWNNTTAPTESAKPRVNTSDMKLPIWRGGKFTTAATWRPSKASGV
jgi:hypothetical protein